MDPKQKVEACLCECYRKIEQLHEDLVGLQRYCTGFFDKVGELNTPRFKPSLILEMLQKDPMTDKNTQLQYMSASTYIATFIQIQSAELDALFEQKYQETNSVQKTWEWFSTYFTEHVLHDISSDITKKITDYGIQQLVDEQTDTTIVQP